MSFLSCYLVAALIGHGTSALYWSADSRANRAIKFAHMLLAIAAAVAVARFTGIAA